MTATCSSRTFFVRLGDMNRAIDDVRATTDQGLNRCVTACQKWRPFPGSALRTRRTRVATIPRVDVSRAAAMTPLDR